MRGMSFSRLFCLVSTLVFTMTFGADVVFAEVGSVANPMVLLKTSKGEIVLELDSAKAPKTVDNLLRYVGQGFYDGLIFHRVIKGFMIQGGGFSDAMVKKTTFEPIPNESFNGLRNDRGTIAMARTGDPDSATAQFFINLVDNRPLNAVPGRPGYAVFGKVVKGMDIVDAIAAVPTGRRGMFRDVPKELIIIHSASVMGEQSGSVGVETIRPE